jgi:hypothetical protein
MSNSKKNFWKFDERQITAKMARRHFKGILDLFPELSTKVRMEAEQISERSAAVFSPKPTLASPQMQNNNEVNFSSPFSIESILKYSRPNAAPRFADPPPHCYLKYPVPRYACDAHHFGL